MIIDLSIAVFSLFPVFLLGFFCMRLIEGENKENPALASVAVNFGIGAGLLYLILFLSQIVTGHLRPSAVYIGSAVLAVLNIYFIRPDIKHLLKPRKEDLIGITLVILISFVILIPTIDKALDGDGWAIWAFKARVFFEDGKIASSFLTDMERYAYAHLDYPLLVPLLEYWVYFHLGHVNDHVIRLVPICFWILMLSFFYSTLSERVKRRHALLGTALLAFTWPITLNVVMGLVDGVQAFYNLVGIVYLFKWFENRGKSNLWTTVLILGFGMNVKNEGLGFWTATIGILLIFSVYKSRITKSYESLLSACKFCLAGIVIYLPWLIEKRIMGLGSELFSRGFPAIPDIIQRLKELGIYYINEVINIRYPGWGLLWIFLLFALLKMIYYSSLRREQYLVPILVCLMQFLIFIVIFAITPYDLSYHIATAGNRTILQVVPAIFWLGMHAAFSNEVNELG